MTDLLKEAVKKSSSRKKPAAKKDDRWVIKMGQGDDYRPQMEDLIELANLSGEISPLLEQRMKVGKELLFEMWTKRMWDTKSLPDNPRIVLTKIQGGKDSTMEDHRCMLQVKFRHQGLAKTFPDSQELPEDETLHEVMFRTISDATGLSEKNSNAFVTEEVIVKDKPTLRNISEMYYEGNAIEKAIAEKIIKYTEARSKSKTGKGTVEFLTDDEFESLGDKGLWETKQIVSIKDGMFERVWNYCDNLEQLRKLLLFCNVTIQVSNFEYALSDTKSERDNRAAKAAETYLFASESK